jgi:hypothetical protein
VRRGGNLGDARVYLVGGRKLQAQVRRRRARLIVEGCCECLERVADVPQGFAVACEVLRLLPCLLERPSACGTRPVGSSPYQHLVVSLSEACQTLLRVVWGGLLLLGGAAEEPHPLYRVSRVRTQTQSTRTKSI